MSLKIMYFLDDGQGFGGAANTLLQQAVLMKKAGYNVLLCTSNDKKKEIAKEYRDDSFTISNFVTARGYRHYFYYCQLLYS